MDVLKIFKGKDKASEVKTAKKHQKNPTKPRKKKAPAYYPSVKVKSLTDKESLFVKYYPQLKWNGTKAAIKAGYSKKTARQIATTLLSKVYIKEAIQKEKRDLMQRSELTQDMVIDELRKIGFSDIKDFINIGPQGITIKDLKDVDTAALSAAGMRFTATGQKNLDFKLHSKEKALELLGKYFGTWNESNKFEIDLKNLTVNFPGIDFKEKKE